MVATSYLTVGGPAPTQASPEVLQPGVQRQQRDPGARRVQGELEPLQRLQDAAPQQPLAVRLPAAGGGQHAEQLGGRPRGHKHMAAEVTCNKGQAPAYYTALPGLCPSIILEACLAEGMQILLQMRFKLSGGDVAAAHAAVTYQLVVTQLLLPALWPQLRQHAPHSGTHQDG